MKIIGSTSAFKGDLDHALGRLKALGFDAVDLIVIEDWGLISLNALVDDFDAETARVRGLLEKHGLQAVSVNAGFSPQLCEREDAAQNAARREQVHALCRFMRALGIEIGAHYPGHISDWKNDPEGVWAGSVETLCEIQGIAKEHGVTLAPEIHFKTPFEAPEAARRLLKEVPGLPYTYEPSHFVVNGLDAMDTEDLLEGACHCHLRTCAPGELQAEPPIGFDVLDWMVAQLKARNYQGILSIEYLPDAPFDTEAAIAAVLKRYG